MIVSTPSFRPVSEAQAQATFDKVVARIGIEVSATAQAKVNALRNLPIAEVHQLLGGDFTIPVWDPEWFVGQDQPEGEPEPLESARPFSSWIQQIVIGATKHEAALFGRNWMQWTGAVSTAAVKRVLSENGGDDDFIHQLLAAYHITDDELVGGRSLDGLIRLVSDGMFHAASHEIASTHAEVPLSLYAFEQEDTFQKGFLHGYSYHSLCNPMLFRLRTVCGPHAPTRSMSLTADKFCEAAITFAHGQQAWEPYLPSHKVMTFNGAETRLVQADRKANWEAVCNTPQKMDLFKLCGRMILSEAIQSQSGELSKAAKI